MVLVLVTVTKILCPFWSTDLSVVTLQSQSAAHC